MSLSLVRLDRQVRIFGATAVADVNSFAHTIAGLDLIGFLIYGALVAMPLIILTDKSLTKDERERIIVIFILAFFVVFFWACFEQAGASLTLFADQQVNRDIVIHVSKFIISGFLIVLAYFLAKALGWFFEWSKNVILSIQGISIVAIIAMTFMGYINDFNKSEFPASWFQSINPLAIIILAPVFSMLWGKLAKVNMEPSSPLKMAFGLGLVACFRICDYCVCSAWYRSISKNCNVLVICLIHRTHYGRTLFITHRIEYG